METSKFLKDKESQLQIEAFIDKLNNKYDLAKLSMSENTEKIEIKNIVVNSKKNGVGTEVLKEIIKYADNKNKVITLDPEVNRREGTTSKNRLIRFYKSFGFVENKGKKIIYELRQDMYRLPIEKPTIKRKP